MKILNNTRFNLTNPFFQPQNISQIRAQREGNPKSQLYLSIHPQNKSREEDSSGVLTIPHDFKKK